MCAAISTTSLADPLPARSLTTFPAESISVFQPIDISMSATLGAMPFRERRCGNFRQAHLLVSNPVRIFCERRSAAWTRQSVGDAFDGHGVLDRAGMAAIPIKIPEPPEVAVIFERVCRVQLPGPTIRRSAFCTLCVMPHPSPGETPAPSYRYSKHVNRSDSGSSPPVFEYHPRSLPTGGRRGSELGSRFRIRVISSQERRPRSLRTGLRNFAPARILAPEYPVVLSQSGRNC